MKFKHNPHPVTVQRVIKPFIPSKPQKSKITLLNELVAVFVTKSVGNMWCAYLFCFIALVSFGQVINALKHGDMLSAVAWLSQTFLQLVLLPIIIVGQDVQARESEKRANRTYEDAEAILHEALEIHRHLEHLDENITSIDKRIS